MSEWFETDDGHFINLSRAFYAGPIYKTKMWGVWGTGDDDDYVSVDEVDVPALQQHLHRLAQVAAANLTPPPVVVQRHKEGQ